MIFHSQTYFVLSLVRFRVPILIYIWVLGPSDIRRYLASESLVAQNVDLAPLIRHITTNGCISFLFFLLHECSKENDVVWAGPAVNLLEHTLGGRRGSISQTLKMLGLYASSMSISCLDDRRGNNRKAAYCCRQAFSIMKSRPFN